MTTYLLEKLLWAMVAAYVGACALALPYLPEQMPLHFGFTGRVTSRVETSAVLWFLPPALCIGLVLLIRAAAGPPEAWNLPPEDVKRFHALPIEVQEQIRSSVKRSTLLALLCVSVIFMSLQLGIYITAVRQSQQMPEYLTILLLSLIVLLLFFSWRDKSRMQRRIRAAAEDEQLRVSSA